MSHFEFIMVMFSIIVGLGVAELLTKIASQIKAGNKCVPYWIQTIVVITTLFGLLQQWWESWGLQKIESWDFFSVLLMLTAPIGLFLIAHIVFPENIKDSDLQEHYFKNSRKMWGIASIIVLVATSFRPIAFGHSLLDWDNLASLILFIMFIILSISNNKKLNEIFVPIFLVAIVADIFIFNQRI